MGKFIRFDWAMRKLLRDKANFEVLEGLISTLLDKDIHIKRLLKSESDPQHEDDTLDQVDILAIDDNKSQYIIELKNVTEIDFFDRIFFTTTKVATEYIEKERFYGEIYRVYSINIIYFDFGKGKDLVYRGLTEFRGVYDQEVLRLVPSEKSRFAVDIVNDPSVEFLILRVNGFKDTAKTPLEEWFDLLKNQHISEYPTAKGLAEAREIMLYDNMSPEEQRRYDYYINNMLIAQDTVKTIKGEAFLEGQIRGRKKAEEEGQREWKFEVAQRLKEMGLTLEEISKATNITITELEENLNKPVVK